MRFHRAAAAVIVVGLCVGILPAAVAAAENGAAAVKELKRINDALFQSTDLNHDGKISRGEVVHFADDLFLSIDANGDDALSEKEFLSWDPGYLALAEQLGKTKKLNEAKAEILKSRDLNSDGKVTHDEYSVSALYDFYRADTDHNGTLSEAELTQQFPILKAVNTALE